MATEHLRVLGVDLHGDCSPEDLAETLGWYDLEELGDVVDALDVDVELSSTEGTEVSVA